jgi:hypothetical protein
MKADDPMSLHGGVLFPVQQRPSTLGWPSDISQAIDVQPRRSAPLAQGFYQWLSLLCSRLRIFQAASRLRKNRHVIRLRVSDCVPKFDCVRRLKMKDPS